MNLRPTVHRALLSCGIAASLALFTGCPSGTSGNGTPTPTPTPTPDPTATPTPTPTATPGIAAEALAADVVATNARIMSAAAEDTRAELAEAKDIFSASATSANEMNRARDILSRARAAFARLEISLYYPKPESTDERTALPDDLATDPATLAVPGLDNLAAACGKAADGEAQTSETLLGQTTSVLAEVDRVDAAWKSQDGRNFRNHIFLPDAAAEARIFQGLVAACDLLILAGDKPDNRAAILLRLQAIRDIWQGEYKPMDSRKLMGKGVSDLVASRDPRVAKRIQEMLDQLILQCESATLAQPASSALEILRSEFLLAARSMGFSVDTLASLAAAPAGDQNR